VAADPGYAPALAQLAGVHCLRYPFTTDSSELDRSLEYAGRALDLDPANAEAYIWRGYSLSRKNRLEESLASQQRAIELNPALFYPRYFAAFVLLVIGRRREAMSHLQQAVVNEPAAGIAWLALGWAQTCLGLHGEASYSLGRALELENEVYAIPGVGGYLGENARRAGALDEARAFCLTGLEAAERSDHIFRDVVRAFGLCALGRIALAQGDTEAAAAAFSQALAQLRSRPHGVGGGHLVVQALAGLSQAGHTAAFDEACQTFASKAGFNFQTFYGCHDDVTLLELARAAFALGRRGEGEAFLARARAAGALEPLPAATAG
jgi:tetratricopeptide (TPR) repeat protein